MLAIFQYYKYNQSFPVSLCLWLGPHWHWDCLFADEGHHPLRQSLSSHPHSSRLAPCPKVCRWVKTTQICLLLQKYTLSVCWSWGTVPDTPGYTAENQVKPLPSHTPFLSPLPTSPLLLGTSRSTAESSVPWQSGVGRRMFLSLWPMALDHVGPEAALFGCCELTWPFVNASLSVSSTKSQNQWGSQSQGGRDSNPLVPHGPYVYLPLTHSSTKIPKLPYTSTDASAHCGEECPLTPPIRTIVDSGTGHPEPYEMSLTPSGHHQ